MGGDVLLLLAVQAVAAPHCNTRDDQRCAPTLNLRSDAARMPRVWSSLQTAKAEEPGPAAAAACKNEARGERSRRVCLRFSSVRTWISRYETGKSGRLRGG